MSLVLPRHLTCKEIVELVTSYLEGGLSEDDISRFEQHVVTCGACLTYVDQMHRTIELVGSLSDEATAKEAEGALLDAFKAFYEAGGS